MASSTVSTRNRDFWLNLFNAVLLIVVAILGEREAEVNGGGPVNLIKDYTHEIAGLILITAAVIHFILHWKWIVAITKGMVAKMKVGKRLNYWQAIVQGLIVLSVLVSGLVTTGFLGLTANGSEFWREMHHLVTKLFLFSVILHLGIHWSWVKAQFKRVK